MTKRWCHRMNKRYRFTVILYPFISLLLSLHCDRTVLAWQPQSISSRHHHDELLSLIRSVGWEQENVEVRYLDQEKSAFCNTVYRLTTTSLESNDTTITIAKIFSPLALARMAHCSVGALDSYVASQGLAPPILSMTKESILMEFIESYRSPGTDTRNADENDDTLCAIALAKLHSLPPLLPLPSPQNDDNMLWRSCRILLKHVDDKWVCRTSTRGDCWTKEMLRLELSHQQFRLSRKVLVEVAIAHGDCKPSNIICQRERILFIDLELCGRNYRAYDLAKLLRNDQDPNLRNSSSRRSRFLSAYAQQVDTDVHQLQFELDEILPLTWLEAAIFFAAMEAMDSRNTAKWNSLSASRLRSYETC